MWNVPRKKSRLEKIKEWVHERLGGFIMLAVYSTGLYYTSTVTYDLFYQLWALDAFEEGGWVETAATVSWTFTAEGGCRVGHEYTVDGLTYSFRGAGGDGKGGCRYEQGDRRSIIYAKNAPWLAAIGREPYFGNRIWHYFNIVFFGAISIYISLLVYDMLCKLFWPSGEIFKYPSISDR